MDTNPAQARIGRPRSTSARACVAALAFWTAVAAPAQALAGKAGSVPPDVQAQLDQMRQMIEQQNKVIGELRDQLQRQSVMRSPEDRGGAVATSDKAPRPRGEAPATAAAEPAERPAAAASTAQAPKDGSGESTTHATAAAGTPPTGVTKVVDAAVAAPDGRLYDSMHQNDRYGLKSLWDSLHPQDHKGKPWYERLSIRGYSQIRFDRSIQWDHDLADPAMFGDRFINGHAENFGIRRARLIFSGDVSDHLYVYIQPDFAGTTSLTSNSTYFAQLRDLYGDVYIDTTKIHRFRVGLSKVPYGLENMQSSQNRVPLDRAVSINTGVAPNERDLGVFYYFTPVAKQKLLKELVDGGLKGSGNYGILGFGVYDGQCGSQIELNQSVHVVARTTWPFQLPSGQVVEASVQGFTGKYVVTGAQFYPGGGDKSFTPAGTGGDKGLTDRRVAGSFIWYPQPFGLETEWNWGEGPGLNNLQTEVEVRSLWGGYVMPSYKFDTDRFGIITPYGRYQYYKGGYRSLPNAPYGSSTEWDMGVEWQILRELELTGEYAIVNGINGLTLSQAGKTSYRDWNGRIFRVQVQLNY
ncbi:MAG: porin [Alphaproteobacteria bacterium]